MIPGGAAAARAFPWRSLVRVSPSSVRALREVRRRASAYVDPGALGDALAEIAGAEVRVDLRRAEPVTEARPLAGAVAWETSPADARDGDGPRVLVEAEEGGVAERACARIAALVENELG